MSIGYEIDIGRVAARQRAIELALVLDEDLHENGSGTIPKGQCIFNGDRRPPLYFVSFHCPDERGHVLMYERRHCFDGDCDHLPISLESADDLLVDAYQAYDGISKEKLKQFEHSGYVEDY